MENHDLPQDWYEDEEEQQDVPEDGHDIELENVVVVGPMMLPSDLHECIYSWAKDYKSDEIPASKEITLSMVTQIQEAACLQNGRVSGADTKTWESLGLRLVREVWAKSKKRRNVMSPRTTASGVGTGLIPKFWYN